MSVRCRVVTDGETIVANLPCQASCQVAEKPVTFGAFLVAESMKAAPVVGSVGVRCFLWTVFLKNKIGDNERFPAISIGILWRFFSHKITVNP
jgi:hypothetical protein